MNKRGMKFYTALSTYTIENIVEVCVKTGLINIEMIGQRIYEIGAPA
jgi:hypothetical protein